MGGVVPPRGIGIGLTTPLPDFPGKFPVWPAAPLRNFRENSPRGRDTVAEFPGKFFPTRLPNGAFPLQWFPLKRNFRNVA